MSRFEECLAFVAKWEGGKSDDKVDRGGRTAFGITQTNYDRFRLKTGHPIKDVWEISQEEVKQIYLDEYWLKCNCGALPKPLDAAVFDAAVQHGPRRAIRWLQASLGMSPADVDGVIGQQTLRYVNDAKFVGDVDRVVSTYQKCRAAFYADIIARDATQKRFEKGWGNRMASLTTFLGDVA